MGVLGMVAKLFFTLENQTLLHGNKYSALVRKMMFPWVGMAAPG